MKRSPLQRRPWSWGEKKKKNPVEKRAPRKIEELTRSELEAKLDSAVSEYVRRTAAAGGEMVRCATCGAIAPWKEMDCGHYISRVFRGTRWELHNMAVQCPRCNRYMGGVQHLMRRYLVLTYGEAEIERMETLATLGGETRMDKLWMIDQIKKYRKKLIEARKQQDHG